MPTIPSLEELLKAGVHFGHKVSKWHPNADEFIYAARGGVHVINLEKTQELLKQALEFVRDKVAEGKTALFVGTKKHARDMIARHAEAAGLPYVNGRWLGGTITNFKSINGLVKRLEKIESQERDPDYKQKYNKRERLTFVEEKERLERLIGGIRELKGLPDIVFILDVRDQMIAIREAHKRNIPVVALVDSNVDPSLVDWPIPANDDSVRSVELMASLMAQAVNEGRKLAEARKQGVADHANEDANGEKNTSNPRHEVGADKKQDTNNVL